MYIFHRRFENCIHSNHQNCPIVAALTPSEYPQSVHEAAMLRTAINLSSSSSSCRDDAPADPRSLGNAIALSSIRTALNKLNKKFWEELTTDFHYNLNIYYKYKETLACIQNEVNKTIPFERLHCWYH
jgi:hypothetical protein